MWHRIILAALLATGSHGLVGFSNMPIRWRGIPGRKLVLAPKVSPHDYTQVLASNHGLVQAQETTYSPGPPLALTISTAERVIPNGIPRFSRTSEDTIVWDQENWCVEAAGKNNGDVARLNHCNNGPFQRWDWVPDIRGRKRIQLQGTSKCIDAKKDTEGAWNEAAIVLQECDNKPTEGWDILEQFPTPTEEPISDSESLISSPQSLFANLSSMIAVLSFMVTAVGCAWVWRRIMRSRRVGYTKQHSLPQSMDLGGVSMVDVAQASLHGGTPLLPVPDMSMRQIVPSSARSTPRSTPRGRNDVCDPSSGASSEQILRIPDTALMRLSTAEGNLCDGGKRSGAERNHVGRSLGSAANRRPRLQPAVMRETDFKIRNWLSRLSKSGSSEDELDHSHQSSHIQHEEATRAQIDESPSRILSRFSGLGLFGSPLDDTPVRSTEIKDPRWWQFWRRRRDASNSEKTKVHQKQVWAMGGPESHALEGMIPFRLPWVGDQHDATELREARQTSPMTSQKSPQASPWASQKTSTRASSLKSPQASPRASPKTSPRASPKTSPNMSNQKSPKVSPSGSSRGEASHRAATTMPWQTLQKAPPTIKKPSEVAENADRFTPPWVSSTSHEHETKETHNSWVKLPGDFQLGGMTKATAVEALNKFLEYWQKKDAESMRHLLDENAKIHWKKLLPGFGAPWITWSREVDYSGKYKGEAQEIRPFFQFFDDMNKTVDENLESREITFDGNILTLRSKGKIGFCKGDVFVEAKFVGNRLREVEIQVNQ